MFVIILIFSPLTPGGEISGEIEYLFNVGLILLFFPRKILLQGVETHVQNQTHCANY